jgi:hypothetical protein
LERQISNPLFNPLAPSRRELALMAMAALLLRLAVFATAIAAFKIPYQAYVNKGDGQSYIACARAILGDRSGMTEYDWRVFPGYPAIIATAHLISRLPIPAAALAVTWVSAALAASGSAALFADRRVGWAMVMLIPHWPINSSLVMSEAPMLALMVVGLILIRKDWPICGGILLGAAGLVRPVACFAVAGILLAEFLAGRKGRAAKLAAAAAIVVIAGIAKYAAFSGDALRGARIYANSPSAYGGRIFAWPGQTLLLTPLQRPESPARILYIYLHVILVLAACAILAVSVLRRRKKSPQLDALALPWLAGNTLFALCVGGGVGAWGFEHFPRFMIPALPPFFWAGRKFLPQSRWIWLALLAAIFIATVMGVRSSP